jgi:ADP-glucose pyrophosphorylase
VQHSVIMDGATIEHPIRIRDSLIFPGTCVSGSGDLVRQIIMPDGAIDCR